MLYSLCDRVMRVFGYVPAGHTAALHNTIIAQAQELRMLQHEIDRNSELRVKLEDEIVFLRDLETNRNAAVFADAVMRLDSNVAKLTVLMQDTWPEANLESFGLVTAPVAVAAAG